MLIDPATAVAAMQSRDPRFDGLVYIGVTSTGVYCRPSCPAVMPKPENTRFYPSAAAAQANGFRACKRCRPDAAPGSAAWNARGDLVGRAMRLIADGVVDAEGVSGLARRLGYSERQVHRLLLAEVGAGPQAVARARRAQAARMLLETTACPVADVAFAAGFASIRQFNDTIRACYGLTPTALRAASSVVGAKSVPPEVLGPPGPPGPGAIRLRLGYRGALDLAGVLAELGARAIPGVEEFSDGFYRRSLRLPHGSGVVTVDSEPIAGTVSCELRLVDLRDLATAVNRIRRLLDLDADAPTIADHLGSDPVLGPLLRDHPGLRVPGSADPAETALRVALGEVGPPDDAVRALIGEVVKRYGTPLEASVGAVTHTFPDPRALARLSDEDLSPAAVAMVRALSDGSVRLDAGASWERARRDLEAIGVVGAEGVDRILVHGLGDPDVPLARADAERWRPWRSYAAGHLSRGGLRTSVQHATKEFAENSAPAVSSVSPLDPAEQGPRPAEG